MKPVTAVPEAFQDELHETTQTAVLGASLGDPGSACLIMELVEGGSLAARIHDRKKRRMTYLQILQVLCHSDRFCQCLFLCP